MTGVEFGAHRVIVKMLSGWPALERSLDRSFQSRHIPIVMNFLSPQLKNGVCMRSVFETFLSIGLTNHFVPWKRYPNVFSTD